MYTATRRAAAVQEENKVETLTRLDSLISQLQAVRIITARYWPVAETGNEKTA